MTHRIFLLAVSTWMMACAGSDGGSSGTPTDTGDAASAETSTSGSDSAALDAVTTDTSAPADDASTDEGDVLSTSCPGVDVVLHGMDASANQLLPFAGSLWMSTAFNVLRSPLTPGGTSVPVPGVKGGELHVHGTKLLFVDYNDVSEIDPATMKVTALLHIPGTLSAPLPRTALVGERLYVLRDNADMSGSELGYVTLPSDAWTSVWSGPKKARDLAHAGDRFFVRVEPDIVTIGAPAVDTSGTISRRLVGTDANDAFFLLQQSDMSFDTYRLVTGAATPTPLGLHVFSAHYASDGTKLVAVEESTATDTLDAHVLHTGGTWKDLPCAKPAASLLLAVAVSGDYAYASFAFERGTTKAAVLRIAFP